MYFPWLYSLLLVLAAVVAIEAGNLEDRVDYISADPNNPRSRGNTFYVGFMQNVPREEDREEPKVQILVSTDEPDPVSFSVTATAGGGINNLYTATYGEITKIELPADTFYVVNDRERNKGICVQAESGKTISVHGINDEFRSTDGFSALSCDGMKIGTDAVPFTRYEYLILSGVLGTDDDADGRSSEMMVIPCEDDTDFTIYPTKMVSFNFSGEFFTQASPDRSHTQTGSRAGETYLIAHDADLSGTIIRSNKPAVVYAGHQCAQIPAGVTACGHLVEQVPPHTTWGHTYFLNPLAARERGDIYHVGTVFNNTQVTVTCVSEGSNTTETVISNRTLNRAYDQNRLEFKTHDGPNQVPCPRFNHKYCCLEATNPVLVAQYSQGYSTDDQCTSVRPGIVQEAGDPFMIVVPPVIQYLNNYTFSTIEAEAGPFPSTYVSITVHESFFQPDMIMMDGNQIETEKAQWNPFYCYSGEICGYGVSKKVGSGNHTIYHKMENAALGVTLYGFQQQNSFGFLGGVELQPVSGTVIECTCPGDCIFPENVGNITITCTRSLDIDIESDIIVKTQPTTPVEASEPMDYYRVDQRYVYLTQSRHEAFNITINDDSDPEGDEAFEITVTPIKNIVILTPVIRVTILCDDNDGVRPAVPVPAVGSTKATTIFLSWSAPTGTCTVESYEVMWERDTTGECPTEHKGSTTITGGSTMYTVTGLEEDSSYMITVTATSVAGSAVGKPVIGMTEVAVPSAPPTSVNITAVTFFSIAVQWGAVDCIHHNGDINSYSVQYGVHGSEDMQIQSVAGGDTTEVIIPGLQASTNYIIKVAAVNSAGTGVYSDPLPIVTLNGTSTNTDDELFSLGAIAGIVSGGLMLILLLILASGSVAMHRICKQIRRRKYVTSHMQQEDQYIAMRNTTEPQLEQFPLDTSVIQGEKIELNVRVTGSPQPKLTWYHNEEKIVADYSTEVAEDGTLTLLSVETRHEGVYQLVAENTAGRVRREMELNVIEKQYDEILCSKPVSGVISVAMFKEYMDSNTTTGFKEEHKALYNGTQKPVSVASSQENMDYNRFPDICPYDDNRVMLHEIPGYDEHQHNYVNASHIDGYSRPAAFIVTQGPLPDTVVDFWRMVWQERSPTIVMLTNIEEKGITKCHQYWADKGSLSCGPFCITTVDQQTFTTHVIRKIRVKLSDNAQRLLMVTQFRFTAWPDQGVPKNSSSMLAFHRKVKKQHRPSKGPMIVHCSSGVDQSGEFITLDICLEQIEKEGLVSISTVVNKIRHQRMKMVKNAMQYMFIHDMILEHLTCGDTEISAGNLRNTITKLSGRDKDELTGFQTQFDMLNQMSPGPSKMMAKSAHKHATKNRSMAFVPNDEWRVVLEGNEEDYIHATTISSYKDKEAYIITQGPMKKTCKDFWKMVYDRKCESIVMLSDLVEGRQEVCYQYWPSHGLKTLGEYQVSNDGEEKCSGFSISTFSVTHVKGGESYKVNQFHIKWAPDGSCSNLKAVTDVIEEVTKTSEKAPVIVHCSDTVSRSGMFCAIATCIEQYKAEGMVDVFQVVKALRVQKPGAVRTVMQYKTIYDAILLFQDTFDVYATSAKK